MKAIYIASPEFHAHSNAYFESSSLSLVPSAKSESVGVERPTAQRGVRLPSPLPDNGANEYGPDNLDSRPHGKRDPNHNNNHNNCQYDSIHYIMHNRI